MKRPIVSDLVSGFVFTLSLVAVMGVIGMPASAGVFSRIDTPEQAIRTWGIHEGKGLIVFGRVLEKEVRKVDLSGSGPVEMTLLRIKVQEQVGGDPKTTEVLAVYQGGVTYRTSAQPSDDETDVGVDAVFFLGESPHAALFPGRRWISGLNAVFPVRLSGSGSLVVIGKGSGMAVSGNARLESFLETHRDALVAVRRIGK